LPLISIIGELLEKIKTNNFSLNKILFDLARNEILIGDIGKLPTPDKLTNFNDEEFISKIKYMIKLTKTFLFKYKIYVHFCVL
jgi:hypothetical protein